MKICPHVWAGRGATAYEWQVGPLWGGIVHLWGGGWNWKHWRRFYVRWDKDYFEEET